MNTALRTGLLAAGALLAYNAFAKGKALSTLNFYPKKVQGIRIDGVTPVVTFALAVQNTSGQNMVLRSFAGNLSANGYYIGNISSYNMVTIRPNSETILLINVRLSIIGVVTDIINAFNGGGPKQEIEMNAKANIENYQIPINLKFSVG